MPILSNLIFTPVTLGASAEAVKEALEAVRRMREIQAELGFGDKEFSNSEIKNGVVVMVTDFAREEAPSQKQSTTPTRRSSDSKNVAIAKRGALTFVRRDDSASVTE